MRERLARFLDRNRTTWFGGVVLPLGMVVLDPAVFRSTVVGVGTPILGAYKPLGYVGIGCGMAAVVYHLVSRRASTMLAGALAGAALFALTLGVGLLPFSFLGTLFFGVGLLGLSPFFSTLAVGWRARIVYRQAQAPRRAIGVFAGLVLYLTTCAAAQWRGAAALDAAVQDLRSGAPGRPEAAVASLARWRFLLDLDQLVSHWVREDDPTAKERLALAYRRLTGRDIEERAMDLVD